MHLTYMVADRQKYRPPQPENVVMYKSGTGSDAPICAYRSPANFSVISFLCHFTNSQPITSGEIARENRRLYKDHKVDSNQNFTTGVKKSQQIVL